MGIGKKTRIQAKRDRREVSREKYKAELIKTISLIFVVGLTASLILVKVITLIYPIVNDHVKEFIKSYRSVTVNPFLKNKLTHEEFKSIYLQKEPILFDSLEGDAHAEVIWAHFEAVCGQETEANTSIHPLACQENEDNHNVVDSNVCHQNLNGGPSMFNFSSSFSMGTIRSQITTPHLVTKGNETKAIAHFRNEISLELWVPFTTSMSSSSIPAAPRTAMDATSGDSGKRGGGDAYPTFQQHPQSWNELIVGRKKWYLYRPGQCYVMCCTVEHTSTQFNSIQSMIYSSHVDNLLKLHLHIYSSSYRASQVLFPASASIRTSRSTTGCSTCTPISAAAAGQSRSCRRRDRCVV